MNEASLLRPIFESGRAFRIMVVACLAMVAWALFAWGWQVSHGLGVTGLNRPVYWGVYITNFVFFIGISHAGTLISAILRVCHAEWRRAVTRMAEVITVLVLFFGVASILSDLGRPDRALLVIKHAHLTSPLIWDVIAISTYLTASSIYLYVPLIPDIAFLRDHVAARGGPRWRARLYRALALGWTGAPSQRRRLDRAIAVLAVLVIPIAISVHTVVSWVFAMTVQPMWHSTIFGPYFVMGAIYSGIAAIIIAMWIVRRVYRLEAYIKPVHFNHLGILLLVFTCLWFYFTFAEFLTTFYGQEPVHMAVWWDKVTGRFIGPFWMMVATCLAIPFVILANPRTRTPTGTLVASVAVCIGMWLERFTIVVPSLLHPRLGHVGGAYTPTWVEWSIFAGCLAMFSLLYVLFTKLFPIVSIWEIREGREAGLAETVQRLETYLPESPPASSHPVP